MKRHLTLATALTFLCLALSLLTLSLSGCAAAMNALDIQNPRYSIRDIRPRVDIALPLSASSIDLDFTLGVDNPNRVGMKLDRIDFGVFINDTHVLDTVSDQRINIPANGIGDVRLRARIGYGNLRTVFREVADVVQGNRARYEIRGNAYYDTPAGKLRFPVTVYSTR
ncbi:MAG TPA: LEA type 2 family protein [Thermoanaerobaculia bacterium]|nr:LEA type 2 family protein [Thermoanaerobaculia bacterium]